MSTMRHGRTIKNLTKSQPKKIVVVVVIVVVIVVVVVHPRNLTLKFG